MEQERRKFQGALNILSFNRHFYYVGGAVLALLLLSQWLLTWPPTLFWIIVAAFSYGLIIPLLVSAYVYDFSGYYDFHWIDGIIDNHKNAKLILNINAGFDETSFILKNRFPKSEVKAFDFYNASKHTEPAIKRARRVSLVYPGTKVVSTGFIPLMDGTVDILFLLSAVHEIRSNEEKIRFLKECHRVCKPKATVVMVEHLRDLPNFLAFSVGFTHFFSLSVWKNAFENAGFTKFQETKFTPFMSVFECSP